MKLFLLLMMTFTGISEQHPAEQLLDQFGLYRVSEQLGYNADNLYDYINGGAEMYRSYGLTGMKGRVYGVLADPAKIELIKYGWEDNSFV